MTISLSQTKVKENDKIIVINKGSKAKKFIKKSIINNNNIIFEKNLKFNRINKNYYLRYFYLRLLIFFNMLNIIISDLGIKITASHEANIGSYKIFDCSKFKKPDKLILNNQFKDIELNENQFIYIQSNSESDNIILIWACTEDKGILDNLNVDFSVVAVVDNIKNFFSSFGDKYELKNEELNGIGLFKDCSYITSIDFTYFDTTLIKNMHRMFDSCIKLRSVTGLSLEKVQNMSYLFHNCYLLNNVQFIQSEISKPNDMEYMFYNCS